MHRINRAEIHLSGLDEAEAGALIERCSALHLRAIAPLLDRICSELSGPGRVDRIDRLELDLGALSRDDFEGEFLLKLEQALRSSLQTTLQRRGAVDRAGSALELLETFATLGNLPWWAEQTGDPVADAIAGVVEVDATGFVGLLETLAGDRAALTRIAGHIDDASLAALVERRWPAAAPAVLAGLRALERAQPDARSTLRAALLASLTGREDAAAPVLAAVSLELALTRGWRVQELPGRIAPVTPQRDLPAALREALTIVTDGQGASTPDAAPPASRTADRSTARTGPTTPGDLDSAAPVALDPSIPGADAAAIAAGPIDGHSRTTLHPTRDEATPDATPTAAIDATPDARSSIATSTGTSHASSDARATSARAADVATRPPHPTREAADPRPALTRPPTAAQRAAITRSLARIDGLHVADAGLVLLWPFLPRLLARCGLLDDEQRFVDERARQRAVLLLEMVVMGELAAPEFRLALAKLLCGVAPDAPLLLAGPLDPALREECEHMLVAVLGHAPGLGDIGPEGLRASFLRRPGVLHLIHGAWSLQVERAPYDELLDRLRWAWSFVKLPWMTDALRVEW